MKEKLIIIGAGNVGGFLALNQHLFQMSYNIIGFLDDDTSKIGKSFWGIPVLGDIGKIEDYKDFSVVIGISNPRIKEKVLERIGEDYNFPNFIANNAWISDNVSMGKGVIVYPNVSINYESTVEDFVIINMNCAIGHNTTMGKGTSLAPGVNFAGFTNVGQFVNVGIGAATIQSVHIGRGAVIGGQSMLIKDVEPSATYIGVPASKK